MVRRGDERVRIVELRHQAVDQRSFRAHITRRSFVDLGLGQARAHLGDGNHRQEAHEQEQQRQEQPDRADERAPVPDRRAVVAPRRRQEIAVQARHDDHEALEPHADVDDDRDDEQRVDVRPDALGTTAPAG